MDSNKVLRILIIVFLVVFGALVVYNDYYLSILSLSPSESDVNLDSSSDFSGPKCKCPLSSDYFGGYYKGTMIQTIYITQSCPPLNNFMCVFSKCKGDLLRYGDGYFHKVEAWCQ